MTSPHSPDAPRVPFVGLTGGIAAGKSVALAALQRLGAATLSTDDVVHDLYDRDDVRAAVVARWGDAVAPEGRVDRAAVAARAFAGDGAERGWLERLLWPPVAEEIARWRAGLAAADRPPRAAVVEVPLLFEAGMDGAFDATIAVVADEDLRARRAGGRGHAVLEQRTARQLTQADKAGRATHVVDNDGSLQDLEHKLAGILATLSA